MSSRKNSAVKLLSFESLRVRLVVLILALTASLLLVSGVAVYLQAQHESDELFDKSLQEAGHLLFTLIEHEAEEIGAGEDSHLNPMIGGHQSYLFPGMERERAPPVSQPWRAR